MSQELTETTCNALGTKKSKYGEVNGIKNQESSLKNDKIKELKAESEPIENLLGINGCGNPDQIPDDKSAKPSRSLLLLLFMKKYPLES